MKKIIVITIICGLAITAFPQNFGIGIASPAAKLHVAGGGAIIGTVGSGSNSRTLTVLGDNTSQISFGAYPYDWSPAIQIQNNDNTKFTWISAGGSGAYSANNARYYTSGSGLDFYTHSNAYAGTISYNSVRFNSLAGSGDRMVIANSNGDLSTQSIPSGAVANFFGYLNNASSLVSANAGYASFSESQNSDASVFSVVSSGTYGVQIKKSGVIMWNYDQDIITSGSSGYTYVRAVIDGSSIAYSLITATNSQWDGLHLGGSYAVSANQVLSFYIGSGPDITAMDNGVWGHLGVMWIGN